MGIIWVFTLFSFTSSQIRHVKGNNGAEIEYIFYSNATHISYIPVDGGKLESFVSSPRATLGYDELNYRLWYKADVKLYNSNLDASDLNIVSVPSVFGPFSIDAVNQSIYYLTKNNFNLKWIAYNGKNLQDVSVSPNNDFRDLQVDTYNRSIFFTTDLSNNRNLIRYSLADGTDQTLHDSIIGIGTHLALDTVNKTIYWVLFTSDSNYKILKTTYDGQTSQIGTDQTGGITTVDIAEGNGYYYILDTTTSQIFKYDKSTDTVATKISLLTEATRIIVVADIDECEKGTDNCHENAICINFIASFECSCKSGYYGNGTNCEDFDECVHEDYSCHDNATCINNDGSFDCICDSGFTGNETHCEDIDECSYTKSVCHASASCTNIIGSFHCACNSGYRGNGSHCEDIDECTDGNHNCHSEATCADNDGSFKCMCNIGFSGNGTYCEDINECSDPPNKCSNGGQTCINYPGAYKCHCTSPRKLFVNDECVDVAASIQGRLRIINRNFVDAYNDSTSLEFFEFEKEFTRELTRVFMKSTTLRLTFKGVLITRLFEGSVGVDYVAGFNSATGLNSKNLQQEMSMALNYSNSGAYLGRDLKISDIATQAQLQRQMAEVFSFKDYDECSPANIHEPDCGNNTTCINTNPSYYCSCNEGFVRINDTDCKLAMNTVKKDDVNVVRKLMIVVLVWITMCFTTAIILVFIAGYSICAETCGKSHQTQFQTELNVIPDTVTSPVYKTHPVMNYYDESEA